MKKNIGLIIAVTLCSNLSYAMRGVPRAEQEERMYGRKITIKNLSNYPLSASVNNGTRHEAATTLGIHPKSEGKLLVNTGKPVTLTAHVNGKTVQHTFHRIRNTENMWKVNVTGNHIEIVRESNPQVGAI